MDALFELSSFLQLLGQTRLHVQQGLQCSLPHARGEEVKGLSPYFKPQFLEKIAPIAKARHTAFFTEALRIVFDMEMLAKQSALSPALLADMLIAKIQVLKHAVATA